MISNKDNTRLKIGFDAKRLFNNFTGLGNYSRTLLFNLQKYYPQHEYHLFTPSITINEETLPFTQPPYIVHQPKETLDSVLWRTARQSKVINQLELDIYHGLSHELPYGISTNTKTCVTFHDLIYEQLPDHFGYWDRKLYQYKYKSAAHRADKVIAISQQTKQDLVSTYKIHSSKIEVIYQSLGASFIDNPILQQSQDFFLYVGSIIERKGLLQIIEAMALIPEDQRKPFCIIGEGKEYKEKCLSAVKKHNLEPYFDFVGRVSNEELFRYYDRCIALVLPSLYEGFGIPIIEALYRKKPVITTQDSAMAEACGPGGILIDPMNVSRLATAMNTILQSETRSKLIQEGVAHIHSNFNGENTSSQLMQLYISLKPNH